MSLPGPGKRPRQQVEQPRLDHRAVPPDLGGGRQVEVELALLEDLEALAVGHQPVLDAVVHHLREVPGPTAAVRSEPSGGQRLEGRRQRGHRRIASTSSSGSTRWRSPRCRRGRSLQSMNSMPCSASVAAPLESRKFEVAAIDMMSPASSSPVSCVTAPEVGGPAGIISQTTRGRCSRAAMASSSVPAQLTPYSFASGSRRRASEPTTVWPASDRRCATFRPSGQDRSLPVPCHLPGSHVGGRSGRAAGTDPVEPLLQRPTSESNESEKDLTPSNSRRRVTLLRSMPASSSRSSSRRAWSTSWSTRAPPPRGP